MANSQGSHRSSVDRIGQLGLLNSRSSVERNLVGCGILHSLPRSNNSLLGTLLNLRGVEFHGRSRQNKVADRKVGRTGYRVLIKVGRSGHSHHVGRIGTRSQRSHHRSGHLGLQFGRRATDRVTLGIGCALQSPRIACSILNRLPSDRQGRFITNRCIGRRYRHNRRSQGLGHLTRSLRTLGPLDRVDMVDCSIGPDIEVRRTREACDGDINLTTVCLHRSLKLLGIGT